MRSSVGISLGSANLVAVTGGRPIVRPAAVTIRPGVTVTGFVDRVGDPVPMLAGDGSAHRADGLAAAAIEAATRQASPRYRPQLGAVAVPGHWSDGAVAALRAVAPHLHVVPDTTAALTAVAAGPGLPARGVVLLVDLGAGGTSITLADAGAGFAPIGPTVRCDEFSGDLVDQALLRHVIDGLELDPAGTSAVASLLDLRAESRAAKERLSQVTATAVAGARGPVRVTRGELEALIAEPLDRLVVTIVDVLNRARVTPTAVVTVGGGARIPLMTQRLSDALRAPVRTTVHPQIAAATGAELLALRSVEQQAATVAVPAAATMLAPAVPALAWSAEEDDTAETEFAMPAADTGAVADTGAARPVVQFSQGAEELPAKKRVAAPVWLAGAACVAAIATAAVLLTSQIARSDETSPASGISTPVAMHALEPAAAPPAEAPQADAATQTVDAAAPAPQPVAVQAAPAPAAPQGQVVAKQAAPAPAPAAPAPAPAPAPAAPAPAAPAPVAPAPVWPRLPLPQFTFPAPTPKPSPTPAPSSTPEPAPSSSAQPTTTQAPTSAAPTSAAPVTTTQAPISEAPATTTAPVAEPTTASPSASESPSA